MKRLWTVGIAASFVLLAGCSGWSSRDYHRSITIGYGGGITGAVRGYELRDNGGLVAWRDTPSRKRIVDSLTSTTVDSAAFYFRFLDDVDFQHRQGSTSGDMTSFITLDDGSDKQTIRWSGGTGPCDLTTFFTLLSSFSARHSVLHK